MAWACSQARQVLTTYSMTLSKEKCRVRLLVVGKGWSYCMIRQKGEVMDS